MQRSAVVAEKRKVVPWVVAPTRRKPQQNTPAADRNPAKKGATKVEEMTEKTQMAGVGKQQQQPGGFATATDRAGVGDNSCCSSSSSNNNNNNNNNAGADNDIVLILSLVLPFLEDRSDWDNACLVSKEVHRHLQEDVGCLLTPPWPKGEYLTGLCGYRNNKKVCLDLQSVAVTPDGIHLVILCGTFSYDYMSRSSQEAERYEFRDKNHLVYVFHRRLGLISRFRLQDPWNNEAGRTCFWKTALSANGRFIFVQRCSEVETYQMLAFSSDFKSLESNDFFGTGANGGCTVYFGKTISLAVSDDGIKAVAVCMLESGTFTVAQYEKGKSKVMMVPTFTSGWDTVTSVWNTDDDIPTSISCTNGDVAVKMNIHPYVDGDINSSYDSFVAIFQPKPNVAKDEQHRLQFRAPIHYPDGSIVEKPVTCIGVKYSMDGKILAAAHETGIRIWDVTNDYARMEDILPEGCIRSFAFHPQDSNLILIVMLPGSTAQIWNIRTHTLVQSFCLPRPGTSAGYRCIPCICFCDHNPDFVAVVDAGCLTMHNITQ